MLKYICKSCGSTTTAKDFDTIVSLNKECNVCKKESKFAKATASRKDNYLRKVAKSPTKTCKCGAQFKSLAKFCSDKCYREDYNARKSAKRNPKIK